MGVEAVLLHMTHPVPSWSPLNKGPKWIDCSKYPVLVIDYPDEAPKNYWIADGVHRLWKAKWIKKHDEIDAIVVNFSDLSELENLKKA